MCVCVCVYMFVVSGVCVLCVAPPQFQSKNTIAGKFCVSLNVPGSMMINW